MKIIRFCEPNQKYLIHALLIVCLVGSLPLDAMQSNKRDALYSGMKKELVIYSQMKNEQEKEPQRFEKQNQCIICLDALRGSILIKPIKLEPCGHEFHTKCLINHGLLSDTENKNTCSLCRTQYQPLELPDTTLRETIDEILADISIDGIWQDMVTNRDENEPENQENSILNQDFETLKKTLQMSGILAKTVQQKIENKAFESYIAITSPTGYAPPVRFAIRSVSAVTLPLLYQKSMIKKSHLIAYILCILLPLDITCAKRIYSDNTEEFASQTLNNIITTGGITRGGLQNTYSQSIFKLIKCLTFEIPYPYVFGLSGELKRYVEQLKNEYPLTYQFITKIIETFSQQ